MTKPLPFTCLLCANAGRQTLAPRARKRWLICEDCDEGLRPARAWCNVGAHIVPARDWYGEMCRVCNTKKVLARRARETDEQRARRQAHQRAHDERMRAQRRPGRAAYMRAYRIRQKLKFFWGASR